MKPVTEGTAERYFREGSWQAMTDRIGTKLRTKPLSIIAGFALAVAFALWASTVRAQEWVDFGTTPSGVSIAAQAGSMRLTKNTDGEPIVVAVFQYRDPRGRYSYERKYVMLRDCANGYGLLVTVNAGDNTFAYSNDFAFGGESAGSQIAGALCEAARDEIAERRSKAKPSAPRSNSASF